MKQLNLTLATALAIGLAGLVLGLWTPPTNAQSTASYLRVGNGYAGPNPRDIFGIVEDTPFIVPEGKLLVVTALGTESADPYALALTVDGVRRLSAWCDGSGAVVSYIEIPPWLTVPSGKTVEVDDNLGGGPTDPLLVARAWAYLINT